MNVFLRKLMFSKIYKGKFLFLRKYWLLFFQWASLGKKLFLILECLCKNIEMWLTRQQPNAAKFVNSWFYTQNHPKIAKISVFGQKIVTIDPFYTTLTPQKHFFDTSCMGIETYRVQKVIFKKFLKNIFLGFWRFLSHFKS